MSDDLAVILRGNRLSNEPVRLEENVMFTTLSPVSVVTRVSMTATVTSCQ